MPGRCSGFDTNKVFHLFLLRRQICEILYVFTEKLCSKPFERIGLHSNNYIEPRDVHAFKDVKIKHGSLQSDVGDVMTSFTLFRY